VLRGVATDWQARSESVQWATAHAEKPDLQREGEFERWGQPPLLDEPPVGYVKNASSSNSLISRGSSPTPRNSDCHVCIALLHRSAAETVGDGLA
jgi:hypothetical protein